MAHEIVIPRLGWSMEEGTFVRWLKNDGDMVQQGEAVFELEGEKASQDIEAIDAGILRILATGPKPGTVLKVGTVVGYLVAVGESLPNESSSTASTSKPQLALESSQPPIAGPSVRRLARELGVDLSQVDGTGTRGRIVSADVQRVTVAQTNLQPSTEGNDSQQLANERRVVATPRARRIAGEFGIDWKRIKGTGANGRVREADVRQAAANKALFAPAGHEQRIAISSRRKVIAQRMVASRQQTVPVTITTKANASNLVNLREQFKHAGTATIVPSYQDIITKLVAETLKQHSMLASRWDEDAIVVPDLDALNLGMAVDTELGLLVPVIRNVSALTLTGLAIESRRLAELARAGKLTAAEMSGGVFTITNLGAFGIDAFTPVINYPETAILGLGAIRREPVVADSGAFEVQHVITLSLTFDHRIVDGAPAARFLQALSMAIATPSACLLNG